MHNRKKAVRACVAWTFAMSLAACGAGDGGSSGSSTVDGDDGIDLDGELIGGGDNSDTGFPNNGSVGGNILYGINPVAGNQTSPEKGFVCQKSASFDAGTHIEIGANGLVGGLLGGILGLLPGADLDNLLNSLDDGVLALDGDLRTAAAVSQTVSGLGDLLNSVDVTVHMPEGKTIGPGGYAVFAVSFPPSLLELGVLTTLSVQTLLGEVVQETGAQLSTSNLSLLGLAVNPIGTDSAYALVGYRTTKPYTRAQLSISAGLLALDLGDKLYIHEFCTAGELVDPPT